MCKTPKTRKSEKKLKKRVDKLKSLCYNNQAVREGSPEDEHRSLKIEQQNFEQNMQVLNKCV